MLDRKSTKFQTETLPDFLCRPPLNRFSVKAKNLIPLTDTRFFTKGFVAEPEQISKHFLEDLERLNSLSHEATA